MDLSFPKLDVASPKATPLGLDFQRLVATCAAIQAATPTATVEAQLSGEFEAPLRPVDALVTLLAGQPGWAAAIDVLEGSFNPEAVRHASDNLP